VEELEPDWQPETTNRAEARDDKMNSFDLMRVCFVNVWADVSHIRAHLHIRRLSYAFWQPDSFFAVDPPIPPRIDMARILNVSIFNKTL
jgi:hypothetical protein